MVWSVCVIEREWGDGSDVTVAAVSSGPEGDGWDGEIRDGDEAGAGETGAEENPQKQAGTHRDDLQVSQKQKVHQFWIEQISSSL